jgi:hypothetical protein
MFPPGRSPLVRFVVVRSVDMRRARGKYWFPASASRLPVSGSVCGFSPYAVLRALANTDSSSRRLRAPSESSRFAPASGLPTRSAFLGVAFPSSRHQSSASLCRVSTPDTVRPRRFSRPRRFHPRMALQVYFTLQPRPGFSLQGFSLSHSRTGSSPAPALSSVDDGRLLGCPSAISRRPALRAFICAKSP